METTPMLKQLMFKKHGVYYAQPEKVVALENLIATILNDKEELVAKYYEPNICPEELWQKVRKDL